MEKNWIFLIVGIILVIAIVGIAIISLNNNEVVQVGNSNFTLPNGYHKGISNEYGAVNITNGTNSIFLIEYNGTDVNKYIKDYGLFIKNQNQTMKVTNFTIDNVKIYKTENSNKSNTVHYWFIKNKKTYDIYKWDTNPNMDSTVIELVKSMGNAK